MEDLEEIRSGHFAGWFAGGFGALVTWGMGFVGVYGTIVDRVHGATGKDTVLPPILGVVGMVFAPLLTRSVLKSWRTWREWGVLRERGVASTATFSSHERSGTRLNRRLLHRIRLVVAGPGGAPLQVEIGWPLPHSLQPYLAPGANLAVVIDPANPRNVIVDWPATRRLWGV